MATEHLLEEFPPVGTAEWEAAIARDLKGTDYEKKLIWHTDEGLAVRPYYRTADLKGLANLDAAPGEFPYRRGVRARGGWRIREEIDVTDLAKANQAARDAIAAGADEVSFGAVQVESAAELKLLVANLDEIPLHFEHADERLIRLLAGWMKGHKRAPVSTGSDALKSLEFAADAIAASPVGFVPFTIHAEVFEERGGTAVEEIGFALAAGIDFLAAMQERKADLEHVAAAISFHFAIGTNYFFEIAKLRALRMMWARAAQSFGVVGQGSRARIAARTSRRNATVYDPHVNILRGTTEAMAAILGGADSVVVAPFDECYKRPDGASRRLARNTQLLLKHEAWLGHVADAAGGSYYVEALTDALARGGWNRMQEIEELGGYRKAMAAGVINRILTSGSVASEKSVLARRRVIVGTNQFANPSERVLGRIDARQMKNTKRCAREFEELRLRSERHAATGGRTPHVLLAEIGDMKMRMARSDFARNFFACAGFEIETRRFTKAAAIAVAESDVIVLCSSDAEYAGLTAELMPAVKELRRETPVIVAGNPESAEQLKAAGIADFVHLRSNAVEVLTDWQKRLGIENSVDSGPQNRGQGQLRKSKG